MPAMNTSEVLDYVVAQARQIDAAEAEVKHLATERDEARARVDELLKSRADALAERDKLKEKLDRLLRETVPLATESTDPDEGMDKIRCATCAHAMERHRFGAGCSVVGCSVVGCVCKYGGDEDPDVDNKHSMRCHRCSHTVARHTGYECSVGSCPCVAVSRNLPHTAG